MSADRALVVQMCRMGDILQTTAVLRRMRQAQPNRLIDLVVLDTFEHVPVPTRLYDRRHVFPSASLKSALAASPSDWSGPLGELRTFVDSLGADSYSVAVSFTPDLLVSYLMFLVRARARVGSIVTADRRRAVLGGWMQYFWATARCRPLRAFNLVDMYTWAAGAESDEAGLEMEVAPAASARIDAWLREQGASGRPLVAFQLGASEAIRQWAPERFAAMADALPEGAADIVLVGSQSERWLAERYLAASRRPAMNAVGTTTLPELGALLGRCRLLVTNDTGTMHVATAVGTRVLEITLGPAFVHETGPYGVGHLVLEPDMGCFPCAAGSHCTHRSCHGYLVPTDVAEVVRAVLDGRSDFPIIQGGRLLESRRTESGAIQYLPAAPSEATTGDLVRLLGGAAWEESLRGKRAAGEGPLGLSPCRACDPAELEANVDPLRRVAAGARSTTAALRRLPKVSPAEQSSLAGEAQRQLAELLRVGEMSPSCLPIVTALRLGIEAAGGPDLRALASAQAAEYDAAAWRASRLADLLSQAAATLAGIPADSATT